MPTFSGDFKFYKRYKKTWRHTSRRPERVKRHFQNTLTIFTEDTQGGASGVLTGSRDLPQ